MVKGVFRENRSSDTETSSSSHSSYFSHLIACGLPAAIVAGMVAIFCICVYVPSYTNKILKYRAGMLPSLHDIHDFDGYRWTADNVVQNVGMFRCGRTFLSES